MPTLDQDIEHDPTKLCLVGRKGDIRVGGDERLGAWIVESDRHINRLTGFARS